MLRSAVLRDGTSKSCGCLRRELGVALGTASKRHGESSNGAESSEYRTWSQMLSRCNNSNHSLFKRYGGRGISVCKRWHTFENFLADMGRRPSAQHSIDRKDNDGNYCKSNCRWATWKTQNRNTSRNRTIRVGAVSYVLARWLEKTKTPRTTYYRRKAEGLSDAEALGLTEH